MSSHACLPADPSGKFDFNLRLIKSVRVRVFPFQTQHLIQNFLNQQEAGFLYQFEDNIEL